MVMLHADTTNAFQIMGYTNVEKDLNGKLNLYLKNKTPH